MSVTNIEWTATVHADGSVTPGRVWNPVTGCTKVSQGCKHCYAEVVANRFFSSLYDPVPTGRHDASGSGPETRPRRFTDVLTHEDRLLEPLRWRKPCRVFVNSMSDLFHEDVPDEFIDRVFAVMALASRHTFLVLTKRPERMRAYLDGAVGRVGDAIQPLRTDVRPVGPTPHGDGGEQWWPLPNVWLGVSVEDQTTADARIPLLLQTPAAIRFVSYEPALGPVDFKEVAVPDSCAGKWAGHGMTFNALQREDDLTLFNAPEHVDWVIVGGESGKGARPFDVAWARQTVRQCREAGVPVFVKQLGAMPRTTTAEDLPAWSSARDRCDRPTGVAIHTIRDRKGGDPAEWPEDLRVREWPRSTGPTGGA